MEEFESNNNDPIELVGPANFQACLRTLFREILEKFDKSYESFSSIIQTYHNKLNKQIPLKLRKELTDYIVMFMKDYFGGCGCYPKISPFKRIPEEILTSVYENYFNNLVSDKEILIYLMYILYIKPFEKIKIVSKNLEDSKILNRVPQELKNEIIKDYIENYSFPIEVTFEKRQEMEKNGFLPLEIGQRVIQNFVLASFHDLSRIDKKILLDLVWSVYVITPFEKRRFTEEKFSFHDRNLLVDLAINEYLELYNHYTKKEQKKK